jgi:hypothetical protein
MEKSQDDYIEMDLVDKILKSAHDARYLQANEQLDGLTALMDPDNELFCGDNEEKRLRIKLNENDIIIKQIKDRTKKILNTLELENNVGKSESEWIYGIKYFGITTYYKLGENGE